VELRAISSPPALIQFLLDELRATEDALAEVREGSRAIEAADFKEPIGN
jgi:hypothetical protein